MRSNIIRYQLLYSNVERHKSNPVNYEQCKIRPHRFDFPIRAKRSYTTIRKNSTRFTNKIEEYSNAEHSMPFLPLFIPASSKPQYPLPKGNKIFGLLERKFLCKILACKHSPHRKLPSKNNCHMVDFGCNYTVDFPPIESKHKPELLSMQNRSHSEDSKNFASLHALASKNMKIIIRIPHSYTNICI